MKEGSFKSSARSTATKRNIPQGNLMVDVAISLWRISKVVDNSPVGSRVTEISERLELKLQQAGYVVIDKTGHFYDPGMPLKVVTSVTKAELTRPTILETISPSILHNDQIIHAGEVVVGTPGNADEDQL